METLSWSSYLVWIVIGLILLGIELVTTTFVMMFFAVGAFVVAVLAWANIIDSLSLQLVVFGGLSVAGLFFFKEKLKTAWSRRSSSDNYQVDAGAILTLETSIAPGAQAEVNYQGSKWTAINESGRELSAGENVEIARVDGLKLILTTKKEHLK